MYDYLHSKHIRIQWGWMYIRFQLDNMLLQNILIHFSKDFFPLLILNNNNNNNFMSTCVCAY